MRNLFLLLTICILHTQFTFSQWSGDPTVNNIVGFVDSPYEFQMISDGKGGAIMVWGNMLADIYIQRINSNGEMLWNIPLGIQVCSFPSFKGQPVLASDSSGGVIIVWLDYRDFYSELFAQRVDSSGVIKWNPDGVRVSNDSSDQSNSLVVSDGAGGAIISWGKHFDIEDDIFAQRIDADGLIKWDSAGVPICTVPGKQVNPDIAPDGDGGAIITWQDLRDGIFDAVYAQKIDSSGVVQWTPDGIMVSSVPSDQRNPYIIEDGNHGAIIVWEGFNGCGCEADIYAQKINSDSTSAWTPGGLPVCNAVDDQGYPAAVSDGNGGAIITWGDLRDGISYDIYAQKVNLNGDTLWAANGVPVNQSDGDQQYPLVVSDGSNGAIFTWETITGCGCTGVDIYSQKFNSAGEMQWAADGIPVCTAIETQTFSLLISDGNNGAISAWIDTRNYPDLAIYASRIQPDGNLPVELSSFSVKPFNNTVILNWNTVTEVNNYGFEIQRSMSPTLSGNSTALVSKDDSWEKIGFVNGVGNSSTLNKYTFVDKNPLPNTAYYRLKQVDNDGKFKYSEEVKADAFVPVKFTLYQNYPNPFNPTTKIKFDIPGEPGKAYPVSLLIFDILGNKIATLVNNTLESGSHEVEFNGRGDNAYNLASGVYFAQLEWNGNKQMKKMLLEK